MKESLSSLIWLMKSFNLYKPTDLDQALPQCHQPLQCCQCHSCQRRWTGEPGESSLMFTTREPVDHVGHLPLWPRLRPTQRWQAMVWLTSAWSMSLPVLQTLSHENYMSAIIKNNSGAFFKYYNFQLKEKETFILNSFKNFSCLFQQLTHSMMKSFIVCAWVFKVSFIISWVIKLTKSGHVILFKYISNLKSCLDEWLRTKVNTLKILFSL